MTCLAAYFDVESVEVPIHAGPINKASLIFRLKDGSSATINMPRAQANAMLEGYVSAQKDVPSDETLEERQNNPLLTFAATEAERALCHTVPDRYRAGLARYFADHLPTGSFLRAILSNDLRQALARMDRPNLTEINGIFGFLTSVAPSNSWGSVSAVDDWLGDRRDPDFSEVDPNA